MQKNMNMVVRLTKEHTDMVTLIAEKTSLREAVVVRMLLDEVFGMGTSPVMPVIRELIDAIMVANKLRGE